MLVTSTGGLNGPAPSPRPEQAPSQGDSFSRVHSELAAEKQRQSKAAQSDPSRADQASEARARSDDDKADRDPVEAEETDAGDHPPPDDSAKKPEDRSGTATEQDVPAAGLSNAAQTTAQSETASDDVVQDLARTKAGAAVDAEPGPEATKAAAAAGMAEEEALAAGRGNGADGKTAQGPTATPLTAGQSPGEAASLSKDVLAAGGRDDGTEKPPSAAAPAGQIPGDGAVAQSGAAKSGVKIPTEMAVAGKDQPLAPRPGTPHGQQGAAEPEVDAQVEVRTLPSANGAAPGTPNDVAARSLAAKSRQDLLADAKARRFTETPEVNTADKQTRQAPKAEAVAALWTARMASPPAKSGTASAFVLKELSGQDKLRSAEGESPLSQTSLDFRGPQSPAQAAQVMRPEASHPVMRQVGEMLHRLSGGGVEIQLRPEELGRVRLHMVPQDQGMTVVISADRSETLDLMRRHVDQLARALQDLGYSGSQFSFSGGQDQQPGAPGASASVTGPGLTEAAPEASAAPRLAPRSDGRASLDITL